MKKDAIGQVYFESSGAIGVNWFDANKLNEDDLLYTTPQPAVPELCAALQSFVDCWSDESGFSNPHPEDVSRAFALLSAAKGE
jgi:hypothetical protein